MSNIKLDVTLLDTLFPFFFVTDSNGQLVYVGRSMKKLLVKTEKLPHFNEVFAIQRPFGADFFRLTKNSLGEVIILKMSQPKAELMGQILHLPENNFNLFILNLSIQDADELSGLNVDFSDFAIQDPVFDYLMLLQTQRRAIKQADEANRKLALAHQVAVKASETKSQFLANMSHELRTPMNGFLAMASILQETELSEEQKDYVNTMVTSGEAMLSLVNDILDLSKIEAGHIDLKQEKIDAKALIEEIHSTLLPVAKKKDLIFTLQVDPQMPRFIHGDRGRLRQVLLNLAGNAVKFTLKGSVNMSVVADTSDSKRAVLQFIIKDTGIGMSPETLSRIFSPFVQGDSSMTKKFEGTGLGLSICKKLIDAMSGTIEVQSIEGSGSEFKLKIPFSEEPLT